MNIGILFDEGKIKKGSYEEFMLTCIKNGVSNLEFAPHEKLMNTANYKLVSDLSNIHKISNSYHVPDFVDPFEFEISNFKEDSSVKKNFHKFFELIYSFKNDNKQIITFHGPKNIAINSSKYSPMDNLNFFTDWALNHFTKQGLDTVLAIENMANIEDSRFTEHPEELLRFIKTFSSSNLSLCYDIAHDYRRQENEIIIPTDEYLKHIITGHIHGYDMSTKESHLPLTRTNNAYEPILSKLIKLNNDLTINIELLHKDYLDLIFKDVHMLKERF